MFINGDIDEFSLQDRTRLVDMHIAVKIGTSDSYELPNNLPMKD